MSLRKARHRRAVPSISLIPRSGSLISRRSPSNGGRLSSRETTSRVKDVLTERGHVAETKLDLSAYPADDVEVELTLRALDRDLGAVLQVDGLNGGNGFFHEELRHAFAAHLPPVDVKAVHKNARDGIADAATAGCGLVMP